MKFKIKALDEKSYSEQIKDVRHFYNTNGFKVLDVSATEDRYQGWQCPTYDITLELGVIRQFLYVDFKEKIIRKHKQGGDYLLFTNVELKHFDILGFSIEKWATQQTKQTIRDWWND